jgi:hypothetical protein
MDEDPNLFKAVLDTNVYQDHCELLFPLFQASREANLDPQKILEVQQKICGCIFGYQQKKKEFEKNHDLIAASIVKKLILVARQIMDSIVWRVLNYDRILIQQLSEHHQTGNVDNTTIGDLDLAYKIIEDENQIVIVNDLTTTLRFGDLTIIGKNENYILETKYGKGSAKDSRAIRQKRRLDELFNFVNTGKRLREDEYVQVFRASCAMRSYHHALRLAIEELKQKGSHESYLTDCLILRLLHTNIEPKDSPNKKLRWSTPHQLHLSNFDAFFDPKPRLVPYGVFPLSDRDCFDLLTSNLLFATSLNFDILQDKYSKVGINFEIPNPSKKEIDFYLQANIGSRKKVMDTHHFVLKNDLHEYHMTPDRFTQIMLELIDIETFIESDKEIMNVPKFTTTRDGTKLIFYTGYQNESSIWK